MYCKRGGKLPRDYNFSHRAQFSGKINTLDEAMVLYMTLQYKSELFIRVDTLFAHVNNAYKPEYT